MCGLNGVLRLTPDAPALDMREIVATRDAMAARGPDGEGLWVSPDGRVAFGHRRLAIIDLSPAGAQPMHSADGRYTLVFNGEIYNHRELRAELERAGARFRSSSDTEVLLHLFARDGLGLFERLEGMYALALWDAREERLLLARDPFGIKPLYYAAAGDTLRFASQVRALEAGGAVSSAVDPGALAGFLLWGSVPEPLTLRRDVRALPAGHVLDVRAGRVGEPRPLPAPSAPDERGGEPRGNVAAALERSVRLHLVSDVPVGIFLSAGLDSALIAALACRVSAPPPSTFTLTFDEFQGGSLDEGPGAAAVAAALGTRHCERHVSRDALEELWPRALAAMDQPSIDGFNVFVVSHFANEAGLKVVLSGLGGDELFGGYPSFRDVPRWARWARRAARVPGLGAAWPALARLVGGHPKFAGALRHGTSLAGAYFLRRGLFLPDELPALLGCARAEEGLAAYDALADAARYPEALPRGDDWRNVQRLESGLYMRNQLLRDADWASLAHGLELRVPLVNAHLWATLARAGFEPARSQGKAALVRRLAPELPASVLTRRKSGFMIPGPRAHAPRAAWGTRSRLRAMLVLRHFGVEVPLPESTRGGTLFLMPEAFRRHGGIQTYNRDQVQALRRCRPDEPLTLLVLNDAPADVRQPEWLGLRAEGCARRRVHYAWRSLLRAWRQQPARIVLGHRNLLPLLPLLVAAAPRASRWLLTYGIEIERPFGHGERLLLRAVTRAFAISPYTAARVQASGWDRAVELWPCSLPFAWRLPPSAPPRLEPPVRLLSVARLAPPERHKGIDDTLRALAHYVAAGGNAVLDVVGGGDDRSRLEALARELGLEERVTFHGAAPPDALQRLYAACDVFVLPSAREGFGIVYLEALAYAKPVVAADAGGAPFVVRPGQSGWLVPYGEPARLAACLAELVAHPEHTRRVGLAGRHMLEREFTFEHLVAVAARLLAADR